MRPVIEFEFTRRDESGEVSTCDEHDAQCVSMYYRTQDGLARHVQDFPLSGEAPGVGKRMTPRCKNCLSSDLSRDASAEWCEDSQDWVLRTIYDDTLCDNCDAQNEIEWVEDTTCAR